MTQMKVFEFAKEVGIETLVLMNKIREWKLPIKSHMVDLDDAMIGQIRSMLESEKQLAKPKKTVARKKSAKATTEEASTEIVKAGAKSAAKKTVVKRTVAAKTPSKKTSKSTEASKPAGIVLRRKSAAVETPPEAPEVLPKDSIGEGTAGVGAEDTVKSLASERAEPVSAQSMEVAEALTEPATEEPTPASESEIKPKKPSRYEVVVPAQGSAAKKNIVGRMDLSRVKEKEAQLRGGPAKAQSTRAPMTSRIDPAAMAMPRPLSAKEMRVPRSGAQRNIRAGFASSAHLDLDPFEDSIPEKPLRKRGAGADDELQNFSATEFRKREMVFQPKKKKGLLAREAKTTEITTPAAHKRVVRVIGTMTVGELAQNLNVKSSQLIKVLMNNGVTANENTSLDFETIALIVPEFQFEALNVELSEEELIKQAEFGDLQAPQVPRAPVVTVMGHVDHGKTTLLDSIRSTNVAAREAGGITQHIGAYKVDLPSGKSVTFIDTPGHEAFTEMRARGANITDIAVIVVAADDGVMPQTGEAINHAKAAGVPIVVAVNKMDKPGVHLDKIKQQLTEFELVPEEWGGSTIFCPVSALQKTGLPELLEQLTLVAEMEELRANPQRSAKGVVIESRLEKGRGHVATLLIQDGTLRVGDSICVGKVQGRVRQMINDRGQVVKEAGPSVPVDILGLESSPVAGDPFMACKDDQSAAALAQFRARQEALRQAQEKGPLSIENILAQMQNKDIKELPMILKTDVTGSLEAIKGLIAKTGTNEVRVKIIHSAVGAITESDVLLAATSKGIIVGFNVRPDNAALKLAKAKGVEIKYYNIIYELAEDLKKSLAGLLQPEIVEKSLGRAEVRNIFNVPKVGTIAGCAVVDGKVSRNSRIRLLRDGRVIYEGRVSSLKRFKDDVKEVASGFECGIGIENYNDLKPGDMIEAFIQETLQRELE